MSQSPHQPELSEADLFGLVYCGNLSRLQEYFKKNPFLNILAMKDSNHSSLLHQACSSNQYNVVKFLFAYLSQQVANSEDIRVWVNLRTHRGHTAIHLASFHGNLPLINLLEENNANIYLKDNDGFNVIHFAAIGDQPISIVYFSSRGISIHEKDNKGRTPLHLAAIDGMINSTEYLTKKGCPINVQDNENGYTPLHYAVISGNFFIVKRLLLKGAARNIKGKRGDLPSDLATRNSNYTIAKLLRKKSWINRYLGIRQGPVPNRNLFTFILFFVLYFCIVSSNIFLVVPYVTSLTWIILFYIFTGLSTLMFLCCWLKDPGAVRNKGDVDLLSLLKLYSPHQLCSDCVIVKPPRSKHCEICQECISVFDHHCTWVNNCVGAKNHKYFVCFIMTIFISLSFLMVMDILHYQNSTPSLTYMTNYTGLSSEWLTYVKNIACIFCSFFGLVFVFPLFMLNYIQFGNLFAGKTTYERFAAETSQNKRRSRTQESSEFSKEYFDELLEPEGKGYIRNSIEMCFKNASNPKYVSYNVKKSENAISVL